MILAIIAKWKMARMASIISNIWVTWFRLWVQCSVALAWLIPPFIRFLDICPWSLDLVHTFASLSVLEALFLGTKCKRSGSTCYRLSKPCKCLIKHVTIEYILEVAPEVQYIFIDLQAVSASLWARSEEIQGFDKAGHLVYYWNITVKRVLDTDRPRHLIRFAKLCKA